MLRWTPSILGTNNKKSNRLTKKWTYHNTFKITKLAYTKSTIHSYIQKFCHRPLVSYIVTKWLSINVGKVVYEIPPDVPRVWSDSFGSSRPCPLRSISTQTFFLSQRAFETTTYVRRRWSVVILLTGNMSTARRQLHAGTVPTTLPVIYFIMFR